MTQISRSKLLLLTPNSTLTAFLCPVSANIYNIEFLSFVISDYETKKTIFEVGKDIPPVGMGEIGQAT